MNTLKQTLKFAVLSLPVVLIAVLALIGPFPWSSRRLAATPTFTPTPKIYMPVSIKREVSLTPDPMAAMSASATISCDRIPVDWVPYTVQYGDLLVYLAPHYGLDSNQLAYFNCLSDPNRIFAGQILHVPSVTPGAGGNRVGNVQGADNIFENSLVVITCRYPANDQGASLENCPRPAVDMLTVAQQYNNGWVFYFPSLNQFYVQLNDGTPMPPFDESNLSAEPYENVSPEDTIERFVGAEQLGEQLGEPAALPMVYSSTVQWTADRQGFTISLPYWYVNPVKAAFAN
jgi:hypothetical protein